MKVIFNGVPREVKSKKLGDIIKELDAPYRDGCIITIISEKKEQGELRDEFSMATTKGEMRIKISREEDNYGAIALFHEIYKKCHSQNKAGRIGWVSDDIVAIGPVGTYPDLRSIEKSADAAERRYKKWAVFFGFGGFYPETTYIMISKREHESDYGTGAGAVIGKLTRGRSILTELDESDGITAITPVVTEAERTGFSTTDLNSVINEGEEIFTHAQVKLYPDALMSSEHFLSLVRDDILRVDEYTHTYIASEALKGLSLPLETVRYRSKYLLSVRNKGTDSGKIYVYKKDRLPIPSHNVFGEIIQGRDLIEYAKPGDTIYTLTEPKWMMVVGKTQKEAGEFLAHEKIEQIREGNKDDSAVVVDQIPALTMEINESRVLRTVGVEEESVLDINLFEEEAPKTVWYFKKVTGLINRPIGHLKVYFTIPGMLVLFQGNADEAGTLVPENLPAEEVKKGLLGVTNMSRSNHRGMMGIRLADNKEYGPTGETLDGANIVLSIPSLTPDTIAFLTKLKEGDVVYVKVKE